MATEDENALPKNALLKNDFPVAALSNLSEKILSGNTTFFVGAGFSIDSENNTAKRLIIRLLARFEATTISMIQAGSDAQIKEAKLLRLALINTFRLDSKYKKYADDLKALKEDEASFCLDFDVTDQQAVKMPALNPGDNPDDTSKQTKLCCIIPSPKSKDSATESNKAPDKEYEALEFETKQYKAKEACILLLTEKYYEINEWLCNAFGSLLKTLDNATQSKALYNDWIGPYETALLHKQDDTPLNKINFELLLAILPSSAYKAGKALFLDTMGFRNEKIMAGTPHDECHVESVESFGNRLKPRHKIIARFAREGLSPILVTTNFDLLLEGGFRHEGFDAQCKESEEQTTRVDQTQFGLHQKFQKYTVIDGPITFFATTGNGLENCQILKVHGCADNYRNLCTTWEQSRTDKDLNALTHYLDSVVFTYREIQNWRKDAWSRDYLQTLLRTQTIVLCSYSGADQVIHDTFRNVFEEMALQLRARTGSLDEENSTFINGHLHHTPGENGAENQEECNTNTPLYVIGEQDKFDFHAAELLRSASRIVNKGLPKLHAHENYLGVSFGSGPSHQFWKTGIDDQFQWLFHTVYRQLQLKALQSELSRVIVQFTGKHPPARICQQIIQDFQRLQKEELRLVSDRQLSHRQFSAITHWSETFHRCLLREFHLLEQQDKVVGQEKLKAKDRIQDLRKITRYVPVVDNGLYTAWSVIIELALRKLSRLPGESSWLPQLWSKKRSRDTLSSEPGNAAAVTYITQSDHKSGHYLQLELNMDTRLPSPMSIKGHFKNKQRWFINPVAYQQKQQNSSVATDKTDKTNMPEHPRLNDSPQPEHWLLWSHLDVARKQDNERLQAAQQLWLRGFEQKENDFEQEKKVSGK